MPHAAIVLISEEDAETLADQFARYEREDDVRSCRSADSGIFAAGDIRSGSMKQVASASGEGASVVALVHTWLEAGDG